MFGAERLQRVFKPGSRSAILRTRETAADILKRKSAPSNPHPMIPIITDKPDRPPNRTTSATSHGNKAKTSEAGQQKTDLKSRRYLTNEEWRFCLSEVLAIVSLIKRLFALKTGLWDWLCNVFRHVISLRYLNCSVQLLY